MPEKGLYRSYFGKEAQARRVRMSVAMRNMAMVEKTQSAEIVSIVPVSDSVTMKIEPINLEVAELIFDSKVRQ